MRILFTSDVYEPHLGGGTEIVIRNLAQRLAQRGHEVAVATLDPDACQKREMCGTVDVRRLTGLDLTSKLGFQLTLSLTWPLWLYRQLKSLRPDVINTQNLLFFSTVPALAVARAMGIPSVLTLQVHSLNDMGGMVAAISRFYERTIGRLALRLATHTVCVGPSVAEYFERLGGDTAKRTVIWNGVDARRFAPPADRRRRSVVLYVGRLVGNKGADIFVEAARVLTRTRPDIEFWLVGDGPMREALEQRATGCCQIKFLGQRDDVAELMQRAAVFVRPSQSEGLSLAIMEAMASGIPIVASDIPGNRDLVMHGQNGYLVPVGDAPAIATAVEQILASPRLRARLGAASRARAEQCTSWDRAAAQLEALFSTVSGQPEWQARHFRTAA